MKAFNSCAIDSISEMESVYKQKVTHVWDKQGQIMQVLEQCIFKLKAMARQREIGSVRVFLSYGS